MGSRKGLTQETKASRAIARCILMGTASMVATYLVWKVVDYCTTELPFLFFPTCVMVMTISLLSTGLAIYKITRYKLEVRLASEQGSKSKKVASYSSNLFIPVSVDKSEGAWYQRN